MQNSVTVLLRMSRSLLYLSIIPSISCISFPFLCIFSGPCFLCCFCVYGIGALIIYWCAINLHTWCPCTNQALRHIHPVFSSAPHHFVVSWPTLFLSLMSFVDLCCYLVLLCVVFLDRVSIFSRPTLHHSISPTLSQLQPACYCQPQSPVNISLISIELQNCNKLFSPPDRAESESYWVQSPSWPVLNVYKFRIWGNLVFVCSKIWRLR